MTSAHLVRWTVVLLPAVLLAAVLLATLLADETHLLSTTDERGTTSVVMHENCSSVVISFERHPQLPLHRLSIVGQPVPAIDADVQCALGTIRKVLDQRKPFTIDYDLRRADATADQRHVSMGIEWARDRANGKDLDALLQCIAFTFRPGFVRMLATLVVQIMGPPQPVHVGGDHESAFQFAQAKVRRARCKSELRSARPGRVGRSGPCHVRKTHSGNPFARQTVAQ